MKAKIFTTFIILSVLNTLVYGCTNNNRTSSKTQTIKQNTSNQNIQFVCDRYQSATEAIQAIQNLTNNRSVNTVINQKKPENHSINGSATTLINQKKSKNYFKPIKKILIYGGITLTVITAIKVWINNLASPTLVLNDQSVLGTLDHESICENLKVSCQVKNIFKNIYSTPGTRCG